MLKPFSRYLTAVEEHLPSEHHPLLRNGLYLAILDWYCAFETIVIMASR